MNHPTRRPFNLILFPLAVVIPFFFILSAYNHNLSGDEKEYEMLGWNIAAGHGYSLSSTAPYELTALREPGYPLFIALIYRIFGRRHIFVYLAQIILFYLTCVLTFRVCKEVFDAQVARYSAVLTAICPTLANYAVIFYSESFFTFLLLATIYVAILIRNTGHARWFMLFGIISGLAVLTKTAMIFFLPLTIVLYVLYIKKQRDIKIYLRNIIMSIFLFTAILSPWVMRNYRLFGIKNLSYRGEMVLLMRALKVDYSAEKIKAAYVYYISEYLGNKFFSGVIENPRDFMLEDDHMVYAIEDKLLQQGYNHAEISSRMKSLANSKIKAHPFRYIFQTPLEFLKMAAFMHIPLLFDAQVIDKFSNMDNGLVLLSLIRGLYKFSGYLILLFVASGIYIKRREWMQHFIILAAVFYINVIYSLLNGYPRYSVPLIPVYFMYAVIAFLAFGRRVSSIFS